MANPLRILHIHTDYKFIHSYKQFEGRLFENTTILISDNYFCIENKKDFFQYKNSPEDIDIVIGMCNNVDIVIMYNLDLTKSKLVLKLSNNVKILWRFFGVELYSRKYFTFLSEKTISQGHTLKEQIKEKLKQIRTINRIEKKVSSKDDYDGIFKKAVNRVDYMLALSQEECLFLAELWPGLPKFIKLPHSDIESTSFNLDLKTKTLAEKPLIIIGHSRSQYNNHLDIIDIIEKHPSKINYDFSLFFNYPSENFYTQQVRKKIDDKSHYTLIENFLPKEKFNKFYDRASAMVINSYRQLAGANIRNAFKKGVKVYLNDKNVHKFFLENEGFKIFSISDFENDLKNNNLDLDFDTAKYNFENYKEYLNRYTKDDFQKILYNKLSRDTLI